MRIQLASDLHLEFLAEGFPGERLIKPVKGADVLVLAGDVAHGANVAELFKDWPVPVLYVMGNHEAYAECIDDVKDDLARLSRGTAVTFLERNSVQFGAVRFLGCTLWTDYLYRCNRTQSQMMENAALRIADHRLIRTRTGRFTPQAALADHQVSRAWLEQELAKPFEGATVVITHHGPHPLSVHPRYAGDATNAAFVSDQTELMQQADFWLHGHVHDSFDYRLGRCRVVANPRGYAGNRKTAITTRDLQFENKAFRPRLVIDTDDVELRRAA